MTLSVPATDASAKARPASASFAPSTHGVRLTCLRDGEGDHASLFLVPGLDGEHTELASVASGSVGPQTVYALSPMLRDAGEKPIGSVERIASLMVTVIREIQPSGPYRLGGCSFGALIAFEIAQQLRAGHGEPGSGRSVGGLEGTSVISCECLHGRRSRSSEFVPHACPNA
jgi:hypothetical protein